MRHDGLFAIGKDQVRSVDCGVIHRCLIEHLGSDGYMFGFELKQHERLQRLGIDDGIATLIDSGAHSYRYFYADKRLRVSELLNQLVQECLPD